jgi:hypothetical protein
MSRLGDLFLGVAISFVSFAWQPNEPGECKRTARTKRLKESQEGTQFGGATPCR